MSFNWNGLSDRLAVDGLIRDLNIRMPRVAREFRKAPSDLLDIRRFGVSGDGLREDTAGVQAWIDAAVGEGVRAYLSRGRYRCSGTITMPTNLEIEGGGWQSILFFDWFGSSGALSGGSVYMVNDDTTNGNTGIRLHNFAVEGFNTTGLPTGSPVDGVAAGILLRRGSDCEVTRVRISKIPSIALAYQGISQARFLGNYVTEGGHDGITGGPYGTSPCTDIIVGFNTVWKVGDDCFALNASVDHTVYGLTRPTRIAFVGNTGYGQTTSGLSGDAGRGLILVGVERVGVVGNNLSDTFASGIELEADEFGSFFTSRDVTFAGNVIHRAGQTGDGSQPQHGYRILGCSNVQIVGGSVTDSVGYGVLVTDNIDIDQAVSDVEILGVGCTGNGQAGVGITAGADIARVQVSHCPLSNNGTYGVQITGGALAHECTLESNHGTGNASGFISDGGTNTTKRGNRSTAGPNQGRVALVNGTATISTTEVQASDNISLTRVVAAGTTQGILRVGTIVAGTSFVIEATDLAGALSADDDSTVFWEIVH